MIALLSYHIHWQHIRYGHYQTTLRLLLFHLDGHLTMCDNYLYVHSILLINDFLGACVNICPLPCRLMMKPIAVAVVKSLLVLTLPYILHWMICVCITRRTLVLSRPIYTLAAHKLWPITAMQPFYCCSDWTVTWELRTHSKHVTHEVAFLFAVSLRSVQVTYII